MNTLGGTNPSDTTAYIQSFTTDRSWLNIATASLARELGIINKTVAPITKFLEPGFYSH